MSKTNKEILKEIEPELNRFISKFKIAMKTATDEISYSQDINFAALKRSGLDLKKELTKLTQSSKYKWNK